MRLPTDNAAGRIRRLGLVLLLVPALAACSHGDKLASAPAAPAAMARANGPAADYPIVVGEPYRVGQTLYTPVDTLNYDEVGYVAADSGTGVTGSHHTLPLPSYVEVTSLVNGHTILVRLERRGPMNSTAVVALSSAALAQLGASAGDPVRVRRVNPPEDERAMLRAGGTAPARMDTPSSLVAVLKRKLPTEGSASLAPQKPASPNALASVALPPSRAPQQPPVQVAAGNPPPAPVSGPAPVASRPAPLTLPPLPSRSSIGTTPAPAYVAQPQQPQQPQEVRRAPQPAPSPGALDSGYIVQAAAMSTLERAQQVAGAIGGSVSRSGQYWRVRTGPFATRQQAEASLAKVQAAGYSDARIFTNG